MRSIEREISKRKDRTINEEGKEMISWLEKNGMGQMKIGAMGIGRFQEYVIRNEAGKRKIKRLEVGVSVKSFRQPLELEKKWDKEKEEEKQKTKKVVAQQEGSVKK